MSTQDEKKKILIEISPFITISLNIARYLECLGWDVYISRFDLHSGNKCIESFSKKYNFKLLDVDFDIKGYSSLDVESDEVKKMIRFYQEMKIPKKAIIRKINSEYYWHKRAIREEGITHILLHNGIASVVPLLADEFKLKIYYIENGYIPNTLQLDNKGVNIDASFSKMGYDDFLKFEIQKDEETKKLDNFKIQNYNLNPLELGFAFIRECYESTKYYGINYGIFRISNLVQLSKKYSLLKRGKAASKEDKVDIPNKMVFIPLQVHNDTQVIYNSPFKSMDKFIEMCYHAIKKVLPEYTIVIKEHPMDVGVNYDPIRSKYPDILWLRNYNIITLLDKAEYVVAINSSVGFQALSNYKKVAILGNSFYMNNPFVERAYGGEKLEEVLEILKRRQYVSKEEIDRYIGKFIEVFIKGGFFKFDVNTLHEISRRII